MNTVVLMILEQDIVTGMKQRLLNPVCKMIKVMGKQLGVIKEGYVF